MTELVVSLKTTEHATGGWILRSILVLLSSCFRCSRQPRKSPSLADQNTAAAAQQDASIGKAAQEQTLTAHLGWNSDYVNVHVDAVERNLTRKLGRQRSFMDVCHVKMSDEDGFLSPQHNDQHKKHHHEETFLDQWCGQRNCVSASHPDTGDSGYVFMRLLDEFHTFPI